MTGIDEQNQIGQNNLMTIKDYLISIHEDWAYILSHEPDAQLTLFGGEDYR